jgi:hypothetical protein
MIKEVLSTKKMILKGTIIDFESTGDFDDKFQSPDPRRFGDISPTIFGYLIDDKLVQYCAEGLEDQEELIGIISETLPMLDEPYFALNTSFERHILSTYCGMNPVLVDVRGQIWARKKWFRDYLDLPHYADPFDCEGFQCVVEWNRGNYRSCLLHNQACLQLERDILEIVRLEPERLPFLV